MFSDFIYIAPNDADEAAGACKNIDRGIENRIG
jgi:hypothetical protein